MNEGWLRGEVCQTSPALEIRVFSSGSSAGRWALASACRIPSGLGMYVDVEAKVDVRLGKIVELRKPLQ